MTKEFVPYELALKLKQLGFDEECFAYYHNRVEPSWVKTLHRGDTTKNSVQNLYQSDCAAPLFQQAFRWFREEHKLFVSIEYSTTSQTDFVITINKIAVNDARDEDYKTYEAAELFALDKLIEIVEIKQRQPNIPEWDGPYAF